MLKWCQKTYQMQQQLSWCSFTATFWSSMVDLCGLNFSPSFGGHVFLSFSHDKDRTRKNLTHLLPFCIYIRVIWTFCPRIVTVGAFRLFASSTQTTGGLCIAFWTMGGLCGFCENHKGLKCNLPYFLITFLSFFIIFLSTNITPQNLIECERVCLDTNFFLK